MCLSQAVAQSDTTSATSDSTNSEYLIFYYDGDPFAVEEEPEVGEKKFKKKKRKKNVFYGIKTRKGYTLSGFGRKKETEEFYYLKKYETPSPYAKQIWWYNLKEKKIEKTNLAKLEDAKDYARILHGTYEHVRDTNVIERANFYKGTKDGRYERYYFSHEHKYRFQDSIPVLISYQVLKEKSYWYKGFRQTSEITYYDKDRLLVDEVTPYDDGDEVLDGYYVKFFKNARKEQYGYYNAGQKVGTWYTYQLIDNRYRKKKIVKYPKKLNTGEKPVVIKEWNEHGKVIMDHDKPVDPTKKRKR